MTSVTRHLPSFIRVPAEALVGPVRPFGRLSWHKLTRTSEMLPLAGLQL